MNKIETKTFDKTEYAEIKDIEFIKLFDKSFNVIEDISYKWIMSNKQDIYYHYINELKPCLIGDFIFPYPKSIPYCVISEKVYQYLFIKKDYISTNMIAKKINFIHEKTLYKENDNYYILLPKIIYIDKNKNQIDGMAWTGHTTYYFGERCFHFNLNISDNYIKDFNKQKFAGITLEKYEEPAPAPENIYYVSNETNVKKKISNFLQEVSKKKILKSKCKYIYYTIIEEENGYTLGVAGYMNKYFDDETFSFDPNMCELTNTDLGKIEWNECMVKLQEIIREIYSINDSDFYKVKAFIGFHDSDIYNIN